MKKVCIQSKNDGLNRFVELFNLVLEKCEYNLNQFVRGTTVLISDSSLEEYQDEFKEMLDLLPYIIRELGEEVFQKEIEKLDDYNQIDKFAEWMEEYALSIIKPYEETECIRSMEYVEFKKAADYCFHNFIIQNNDLEKTGEWEEQNIDKMKKVFFTFIDTIIIDNCGKKKTINEMGTLFGMSAEKNNYLFELIKSQEEKLWKLELMRKYTRIEHKLDTLISKLV